MRVKPLLLKARSSDQKWHHLETQKKCRISASTPNVLNKNLYSNKISKWFIQIINFKQHCSTGRAQRAQDVFSKGPPTFTSKLLFKWLTGLTVMLEMSLSNLKVPKNDKMYLAIKRK